jgi:hypothetical protein
MLLALKMEEETRTGGKRALKGRKGKKLDLPPGASRRSPDLPTP